MTKISVSKKYGQEIRSRWVIRGFGDPRSYNIYRKGFYVERKALNSVISYSPHPCPSPRGEGNA